MVKELSTPAQAAKEIKAALKLAFPGIVFNVKSDSFAGGDAVRIKYFDGVKHDKVSEIVAPYQYGSFDGMNDLYNYDNKNAELPQVKYVNVSRSMSDAVRDQLLNKIITEYAGCENLTYDDYAPEHGAYVNTLVGRLFAATEF
jgi:hypothetical protein